MEAYRLRPVGDRALSVEFENEISMAVNRKVRALDRVLSGKRIEGLRELIPSYRALLIRYDPLSLSYDRLSRIVGQAAEHLDGVSMPRELVTEIPVLYEGEYAQDLEEIARLENKTVEEVIRIHSSSDYYIYMLGFAPGHPYAARFENPFSFRRRPTPRVKIPGGSIVVQLDLSDVIPFDQPCGWNIIGTTPLLICDYRKEDPFLLRAGQWIRHVPIDRQTFMEIKRQVELGKYQPRTYEREV